MTVTMPMTMPTIASAERARWVRSESTASARGFAEACPSRSGTSRHSCLSASTMSMRRRTAGRIPARRDTARAGRRQARDRRRPFQRQSQRRSTRDGSRQHARPRHRARRRPRSTATRHDSASVSTSMLRRVRADSPAHADLRACARVTDTSVVLATTIMAARSAISEMGGPAALTCLVMRVDEGARGFGRHDVERIRRAGPEVPARAHRDPRVLFGAAPWTVSPAAAANTCRLAGGAKGSLEGQQRHPHVPIQRLPAGRCPAPPARRPPGSRGRPSRTVWPRGSPAGKSASTTTSRRATTTCAPLSVFGAGEESAALDARRPGCRATSNCVPLMRGILEASGRRP